METVRLTGRLICADPAQVAIVVAELPRHTALSRAEPGCLSFTVLPTADPLIFSVEERFVDAAAFAAHQERVRTSEWGQRTAEIARDYTVSGRES